jgi:hypothetical protein
MLCTLLWGSQKLCRGIGTLFKNKKMYDCDDYFVEQQIYDEK